MKTVDVSDRVMKKVVGFERKRISTWLRGFIVLVAAFVIACGTIVVLIVRDLLEKRAFDLFELFIQDPEIIAEFWQDTLSTFWNELPQEMLFIIAIMLFVLVFFVIITRRKRTIIQKKLHQLEKYS